MMPRGGYFSEAVRTASAAARLCGVTSITSPSMPLTRSGEPSVESSLAARPPHRRDRMSNCGAAHHHSLVCRTMADSSRVDFDALYRGQSPWCSRLFHTAIAIDLRGGLVDVLFGKGFECPPPTSAHGHLSDIRHLNEVSTGCTSS
jgi:hypothetical protein